MKSQVVKSVALIVVLCWSAFACAQTTATVAPAVPGFITYSGVLRDSTGKMLTSTTGVTFLIYKDEQGGAPLWMETQNVTPDRGHYTVQLGSTTAQGLPSSIFQSGEARWLAVQVVGEPEHARVLLVAVPYAMKAQDAETVGGLPASAFVLAGAANGAAVQNNIGVAEQSSTSSKISSDVTTSGGTVDSIPLFSTATNVQSSILTQTGSGTTAKIGINTTTPAVLLDVNGSENVRGVLNMATTGTATTSAGKNSQPFAFTASSYNSSTKAAVVQNFRWQAEPAGNDTATPTATVNLLYSSGSAAPAETGLKINNKGQITFASGQTFPGASTITDVKAGTDLTGGGTSGTVTLNLNTSLVPTLAASNTFTGYNNFHGGLAATTSNLNTIVGTTSGSGYSGVYGIATATSGESNGVLGTTTDASGAGVVGIGRSTTSGGSGVAGYASLDGYAVLGVGNDEGIGVYGTSPNIGVEGFATGAYAIGVLGQAESAPGGSGNNGGTGTIAVGGNGDPNTSGTSGGDGIEAVGGFGGPAGAAGTGINAAGGNGGSDGSDGMGGYFVGGNGTSYGDGIYAKAGESTYAWAGDFNGDVNVSGSISKSSGSFKIDDPLDPANKYLYHSFVESPDMKNIYDGVATLDANGEAVIQMPEWFGVLNRDFRYQLTCIGGFAPVFIAEKLSNNQFKIGGGHAGMEISWQITGIRQDAWANAHRIPVEEQKEPRLKGFYIHPELYGAPPEKQIEFARHPQTMKKMQDRRQMKQKLARLPQSAALARGSAQ